MSMRAALKPGEVPRYFTQSKEQFL
jgi:hypothetical protein